jgi:hypothetical protein
LPYHLQLSNSAFGNWRQTLMSDITLNPAMGNYLDMDSQHAARIRTKITPARFCSFSTIGLFMLNQDGTLQLDGQQSADSDLRPEHGQ